MIDHQDIGPPSANLICPLFDIGDPIGEMTPVTGGQTHRSWKLTTTRGAFIVKEINRDWGNPNYVAWYERAFRFELAARDAGILAPRPVAVAATGACLGELPQGGDRPVTVRLHEWIDGAPDPQSGYGESMTHTIGSLLARLHLLGVPADDRVPDRPRQRSASWPDFAAKLEASGASWAHEMSDRLQIIGEIERFAADARIELAAAARIMSHRDVAQQNVMRAPDGQLALIDWDASGPVTPREEFAKTAIDWIGWYWPDATLARSYVRGYIDAGGSYDRPRPADFGEMADVLLGWCEYNVRRVLGERLAGEAELAIAEKQARRVVSGLPRFLPSIKTWIEMLSI